MGYSSVVEEGGSWWSWTVSSGENVWSGKELEWHAVEEEERVVVRCSGVMARRGGRRVRWLGLKKSGERALVFERSGSVRDRRGLLLPLRYSGECGSASGLREDTSGPKDDGFGRRCVDRQSSRFEANA